MMARKQRNDLEPRAVIQALRRSGDEQLPPEEAFELVRSVRGLSGDADKILDRFFSREVLALRRALEIQKETYAELQAVVEKVTGRPHHPAIYGGPAESESGDGAIVWYGNTWRIVNLAEEVDPSTLECGDWVVLGPELNVLLKRIDVPPPATGETGSYERHIPGGDIVLRHRDEEVIVRPADRLEADSLEAGDTVRWDRAAGIAFDRLERSQGESLFLEDTPEETFADVRGLEEQVLRLKRAVALGLEHREIAEKYGLRRRGGITLAGPSGCGKTLAGRATANFIAGLTPSGESRFMYVKPGALHSMWYAQTEANYREAFRVARQAGEDSPEVPVLMFFDEVDAVGAARGESLVRVHDRVLQAILAELDGLTSRGNIMVIGATNRADALDPALIRPGRLGDDVIEIPRPNREAARDIFDRYLDRDVPLARGLDREEMIDAALANLYAPNGSAQLATVVLRDGAHREVRARDLISGAVIENIVNAAKERACVREIETRRKGVRLQDLLAAAAEEFNQAVRILTPANCRNHLCHLPDDVDVVSVQRPDRSRTAAREHRFLRSA
jgi:proteasome-associated ATPase